MATNTPKHQDLQALEVLRKHRRQHREKFSTQVATSLNESSHELTPSQKNSDRVAKTVGSWKLIIIQSVYILGWIGCNSVSQANAWDPYPDILLNPMLSFQAAYTAPIIMKEKEPYALTTAVEALSDELDAYLEQFIQIVDLYQDIS